MAKRRTRMRHNRRHKKRKTRRNYSRGGNTDNVKCCMCEKNIKINNTLVPRECLVKYGKIAHRICQDCWWDPNIGFAREDACHKCPGCQKGLPLTEYKKEAPIFVDLTED